MALEGRYASYKHLNKRRGYVILQQIWEHKKYQEWRSIMAISAASAIPASQSTVRQTRYRSKEGMARRSKISLLILVGVICSPERGLLDHNSVTRTTFSRCFFDQSICRHVKITAGWSKLTRAMHFAWIERFLNTTAHSAYHCPM